ncbi:MAG TPA: 2-phosphosulfolactate phosphatase [Ktedonobacterales bacterium]
MTDNSHAHATSSARSALVIDVALTPDQLDSPEKRTRTTCIVVDVIRATTTLCVLFERGCRSVLVAPSVAGARAARSDMATSGMDMLLAGEVEGLPPPGFDYGNSPAEFARRDLRGHEVIFATTNGTRAIRACAGSRAILTGALRNASAVTHAALALTLDHTLSPASDLEADTYALTSRTVLASEAHVDEDFVAVSDIVVVCSGRGGRPALDDTLCAGYLVRRLVNFATEAGMPTLTRESARIALAVLAEAEHSGSLRDALSDSSAARAVERIGLVADLDLCATVDASNVVPMVSHQAALSDLPNLLRIVPYVK